MNVVDKFCEFRIISRYFRFRYFCTNKLNVLFEMCCLLTVISPGILTVGSETIEANPLCFTLVTKPFLTVGTSVYPHITSIVFVTSLSCSQFFDCHPNSLSFLSMVSFVVKTRILNFQCANLHSSSGISKDAKFNTRRPASH